MSATLTETIESLHITAAQKLLELINTETDPQLLARLIATAFRFKLPKPNANPAAADPTSPPLPNRDCQRADRRANSADSPKEPPCTTAQATSPSADLDEPEEEELHVPPPPPYTDQQFHDLVKQYGFGEADAMRQRRYAIIAQMTRGQRQTSAAG